MSGLRFVKHARDRFSERGITEELVQYALNHPIGDPEPGDAGKTCITGQVPGGRILKVVLAAEDRTLVVTAYFV